MAWILFALTMRDETWQLYELLRWLEHVTISSDALHQLGTCFRAFCSLKPLSTAEFFRATTGHSFLLPSTLFYSIWAFHTPKTVIAAEGVSLSGIELSLWFWRPVKVWCYASPCLRVQRRFGHSENGCSTHITMNASNRPGKPEPVPLGAPRVLIGFWTPSYSMWTESISCSRSTRPFAVQKVAFQSTEGRRHADAMDEGSSTTRAFRRPSEAASIIAIFSHALGPQHSSFLSWKFSSLV